MVNTSLLGAEGTDGGEGNTESFLSETLNVEVVPTSSVWPEMLLISKKSLPGTVGSAGVEGKCELSFSETLNVEVVLSSEV